MLPGYVDTPYFSPILVRGIRMKSPSSRTIELDFLNVRYAAGLQDFSKKLRILKHTPEYLLAVTLDSPDRTAIISNVTFAWLENFCEANIESRWTNDVQAWLNRAFLHPVDD